MSLQLAAERHVPVAEDRLRAEVYGLIAGLLAVEPDAGKLAALAQLSGDGSELGVAYGELAHNAATMDLAAVRAEYVELFIGIGRGELLPYGSYYLTGFLNEKPLARLRRSMAALGIARASATSETEDHAAALLDMMAGLITGRFSGMATLAAQREFFREHVASWMPHFFRDLEKARAAAFYRPVGTIGRLFMEIEAAAFEME